MPGSRLPQVLALLAVAGCASTGCASTGGSAGQEVVQSKSQAQASVSEPCARAMASAAARADGDASDPLVASGLDACATADEWLTALALHPGAMGLRDAGSVSEADLRAACAPFPDTVVCRAAAEQGIVDG